MGWWRLRRRVHGSWRVGLACLFFVIGVCAALWVRVPPLLGLYLLIPVLGLLFVHQAYTLPFVACGALFIGLAYGSVHLVARDTYALYTGKEVMVRGRVKEDISHGSSGGVSMQLNEVLIDGTSLPGTILVTGRTAGGALRGDVIELQGKAKEGFGNFPVSIALNKIITITRQQTGDVGRVVRDWFAGKVREGIPEPQASLGIGFLTGQKSALPIDLADALKVAGLTHIVVASGYNLTILVRLARKMLLKVSKYLSALSSAIMIVGFVAITGLSPSMTRAGLVSGMSLLSWYYGHAFHPFVLLPVAAAITVIVQPSYVWGDMGWQLSFSAFMGVMVVAPLLQTYFFGNKEPSILRQILGETIAAHLVTIPIIALGFGTVSNVAIVANLLVVPLVPLAMLLTFICGLSVIVSLPFIDWITVPTTWLLAYMTNVATFVSELPWAQSEVSLAPIGWAGYVIAVGLACFWMWRKTKYSFRDGQSLLC